MKIKKIKFKFKRTLAVLLILVTVLFVFSRLTASPASADWFNDAWSYRIGLTFTNSGSADANKYITVTLTTNTSPLNKLQSDCDDARFTDSRGSLLQYYQTNSCQGASTIYHVLMPSIPAGNNILYFYYGNPTASAGTKSSDFSVTEFTTGTITPGQETIGGGPLVYWKLNDGNGTSPNDSSGHNIPLKFNSAPVWKTENQCADGKCLSFDGIDDYSYATYSAYLNVSTSPFSTSVWFNQPSTTTFTGQQDLLSRYNGSGYKIYMNSSGQVCFGIDDDSTWGPDDSACSAPSYNDSKWHHAEGVRDTASITLYVDGQSKASKNSLTASGTLDGTSPDVNIGAGAGETKLTYYVANNNDDGSECPQSTWGTNSWFGHTTDCGGSDLWMATRFQSVNVAKNAGIVSATYKVTARGDDGGFTVHSRVKAQKIANASAPSGSNLPSGWTNTTAYTDYNVTSSLNWVYHTVYPIDATAIVQEIVNQASWAPNNSINIITLNNGTTGQNDLEISDYGNTPTEKAELDISYASSAIGRYWSGSLDDIKIYPYARSTAQVKTDFTGRGTAKGAGAVMGSNQSATDNLSNGLVAWWKMDENTGTQLLDASGNSNTVIFGGGANNPTWSGGKFGSGLSFASASTQFAYINDVNKLDMGTGSFTISTWITRNNGDSYDYLVTKKCCGGNNRGYTLGLLGNSFNDNSSFTVADGTVELGVEGNTLLETNTWYHLVAVIDRSAQTMRLYVNSRLDGTTSIAGLGDISNGDTEFALGTSQPTGSQYNPHDGKMDETRIYNRVLSDTEIETLYSWAPGPVGYWKFDEGSGNTANDSSGNNLALTLSSASFKTGKFGNALSSQITQDGHDSGAYRTDTTGSPLDLTGDLTISFWLNVAALPDVTTNYYLLVSKGNTGTDKDNNYACWMNWLNPGTRLYCVVGNGTTYETVETSGYPFTANTWYHIEFVHTTNARAVYVNGILQGTNISPLTPAANNSDFIIGGRAYEYPGLTDDVRIYNYIRTPKQILEDMNSGHPAVSSTKGGSVAHWQFNEGSGTIAHDISGNNLNLTVDPYSWTPGGKYGPAWIGDGTHWASISDDPGLDFAEYEDFTISAWVKHAAQTNLPAVTAYRFNAYDTVTEKWTTTPGNMVDNNTATYASTATALVEKLTGSAYDATGSGTITKVSLRVYGRNVGVGSTGSITLRPVFNGTTDGDNHSVTLNQTAGWKTPVDITNDTNHPAWTWADIGNLDVDVVSVMGTSTAIRANEVEIWVDYTSANTVPEYLVAKSDATNGGYKIYLQNHKYCFAIDDDSTWDPDDVICSLNNYDDSNWHQVTVKKTGTSRIDLYVDGVLVNNKTSLTATNTLANSGPFYIGDQDGTDNGDEFIGSADDVQIFRAALSDSEIKALYNQNTNTVMGAVSTSSNGKTADNSTDRSFCVPGDASACSAPIGWWKFDENTGSTANDASGNVNTGSLTNSAAWTAGRTGSGVMLNGTNQRVTLANDLPDPTAAFTVSAWIKPTQIGVQQGIAGSSSGSYFYFNVATDNSVGFCNDNIGLCADQVYTTAGVISQINTWYHVVVTHDGSRNYRLYVNGVDRTSKSTTSVTNSGPTGANIGYNQAAGYFHGAIDDVKFYDYTRTPAQVAWDYNHGGPVAQYDFNECSGSTVHDTAPKADRSTAGFNGTISLGASGQTTTGDCNTNANTPWYNGRTGKFGPSLNFDGTDDNIISNLVTSAVNNFTVSAWIKWSGPGSGDQSIVFNGDRDNCNGWTLDIRHGNGDTLSILSHCRGEGATSYQPPTGIWTHVTGIVRNGVVEMYINGQGVPVDNSGYVTPNTPTVRTVIGSDENPGWGQFQGQIDDVKIFNYPLTPLQVKNLYNNGSAVSF